MAGGGGGGGAKTGGGGMAACRRTRLGESPSLLSAGDGDTPSTTTGLRLMRRDRDSDSGTWTGVVSWTATGGEEAVGSSGGAPMLPAAESGVRGSSSADRPRPMRGLMRGLKTDDREDATPDERRITPASGRFDHDAVITSGPGKVE